MQRFALSLALVILATSAHGQSQAPAPYYPAVEADAQQARQLAGLEGARPVWHVEGEDGIAYVELEPTTASGTVSLRFSFRDGDSTREQRLEAWLDPGERPWTVVGLAEGTLGFNRLDRHMERLADNSDDVITDINAGRGITAEGAEGEAPVRAAFSAVRVPLVFATLALLLGTVPFLFLGSVVTAFSRPAAPAR